jgi:hypothetical protein
MKTENNKHDEYAEIKKIWYFFGDIFDFIVSAFSCGFPPPWRKRK